MAETAPFISPWPASEPATQPPRVCAANEAVVQPNFDENVIRSRTLADWMAGSSPAMVKLGLVLKLIVAFALMLPVAACGTKTELLMPNGKPTPRDQRDPSQPPSPISR
jgi:predicted small lipoprotein YifL